MYNEEMKSFILHSTRRNIEPPHQPCSSLFFFPNHVVPQRLTFSDLLLFRRNAHLPTLLPGKSISVADDSSTSFSLDGTPITHPDIYKTTSIVGVLNYSLYGNGKSPSPPPPLIVSSPSPNDVVMPPFLLIGETLGGMSGSLMDPYLMIENVLELMGLSTKNHTILDVFVGVIKGLGSKDGLKGMEKACKSGDFTKNAVGKLTFRASKRIDMSYTCDPTGYRATEHTGMGRNGPSPSAKGKAKAYGPPTRALPRLAAL
ncbi:hypothetical protein PIB30_073485 [Stylosanthes scabra]|uniref:Uncharacterized protein n=1 Tax=Stylosanthes scabra TaxID=79078 RepID=A0ABU6ZN33_9FABA|nr:hypothetical protein [Stylosanthes scabra]